MEGCSPVTIRLSMWTVDERDPKEVRRSELGGPHPEQLLEDMIVARPSMLDSDWMLIGRQVRTATGGYIDLLAIAPDGSVIVIELKRGKTPRDVVAQGLDYASWVADLGIADLMPIYKKFRGADSDLLADMKARFGSVPDDDEIGSNHQIAIVASTLDQSTERIVNYLAKRDIAINTLFFDVFELDGKQLITRHWLLDPSETQVASSSATSRAAEPWNGEYYVSFGDGDSRSWQDAREFGFISGGGGPWYSQTLRLLHPGDRIWVRIPKVGYVGCGVVTDDVIQATEYKITIDGTETTLKPGSNRATYAHDGDEADENREYVVPVRWVKTLEQSEAVNETGLFGNQNTVCRPTTPNWRHTIERLHSDFALKD